MRQRRVSGVRVEIGRSSLPRDWDCPAQPYRAKRGVMQSHSWTWLLALAVAHAVACASNGAPSESPSASSAGGGSEGDILDIAARRGHSGSGAPRADARLDAAVKALADIPRPWTVPSILELQAREADATRRAHQIALLAASADPRAGVRLGEALESDPSADVRVAATWGLIYYFVDKPFEGGSEQAAETARAWWRAHESELRRAATPPR
jgi:hypothetical protein